MSNSTEPAELTEKQRQILDYIYEHLCAYGYQPSMDDLADRFGWAARSAVNPHMRGLRRKGYVQERYEGNRGESRALRLLKLPDGSPFLGLRIR
jgi:SOS-response transcriptional repressor LexA